jgi:hypothetical protein
MGKNWDNLVVTDKFNITGRGVVLIDSIIDNLEKSSDSKKDKYKLN